MDRLLVVLPLPEDRVDEHQRWCDELRERRGELARSRRRLGIVRQVQWVQPNQGLVVLRTDAADPAAALRRLACSSDPFDRWYAEREAAIHGGPPPVDGARAPELLNEYRNGEPDPFDLFIAAPLWVRPGYSEPLRQAVRVSAGGGGGMVRLRRWRLKRLAIWIQALEHGDVVVYESAGDIPEMIRSLTEDSDPLVAEQRSILNQVFGLDLPHDNFPVPLPAFAWSAEGAPAG